MNKTFTMDGDKIIDYLTEYCGLSFEELVEINVATKVILSNDRGVRFRELNKKTNRLSKYVLNQISR